MKSKCQSATIFRCLYFFLMQESKNFLHSDHFHLFLKIELRQALSTLLKLKLIDCF